MDELRQGDTQLAMFSSKAEKYAKYRWTYAPLAIQAVFEITKINEDSLVADIGAGTGILTREFCGKVRGVYAVEPNPEMRAFAARELAQCPSCNVIDGRAEATTLEAQSIDLICAAQAVHWFEPQATRMEFIRILKPGGWLALLRNYGTDAALGQALKEMYPPEQDTSAWMIGKDVPASFYYGQNAYQKLDYPFQLRSSWDEFLGSLSTASFAPDEGDPLFPEFERRARSVFDRFSAHQMLETRGVTELYLGQIHDRS